VHNVALVVQHYVAIVSVLCLLAEQTVRHTTPCLFHTAWTSGTWMSRLSQKHTHVTAPQTHTQPGSVCKPAPSTRHCPHPAPMPGGHGPPFTGFGCIYHGGHSLQCTATNSSTSACSHTPSTASQQKQQQAHSQACPTPQTPHLPDVSHTCSR
jgi:hypothetical protein